ncbi:MAG: tetratricopeptide repeat protein, partial [Coleofasciculaceae cyanobacterium]
MQSHPHNIEVLRRYGNALAGIKRYEEAFRAFEQALQLKPNNSKVFKDYIYALSSSDQQEKVLPFLEHLLNTEPQNYKIFHSYAIQLNSTFKYSKALPFFKYLVKIEPDNPDILYTYVGLLHSNGENEKALLCLDKLLQMEPNNVAALMGYLKILPLTGQYEKTGSFQKKLLHTLVLEIRHKYQEAINQLAVIKIEDLTPYQANVIRVNLGRLYYRIKESEKGNEYFEAAITNSDDKERTLLDSAYSILANNPHSDKAVEMLQQIAETSPRYAQAFEMLTLYLSEEDYFDMVKT